MTSLLSFVAGLTFGFGLIVSGMSNPEKVLGFLDLSGRWDPSLIFVMIGAITLAAAAFWLTKNRDTSLLCHPVQIPTRRRIDRRLMAGSALFGVGWGLAGICPGPALVLLGTGTLKGLVFVLAMLAGMALFEVLQRFKTAR